jgi:hypothetical protein
VTRLIAQVVEGFGEVESVPQILTRHLSRGSVGGTTGEPVWLTYPPINARGRGNLIAEGALEANIRIAKQLPGVSGILVVLDGEGDAVCQLGPDLQARAEAAAQPLPVRVCLANEQFENWLASCELNGQEWAPADGDYEGPGAEASLKERMPRNRYKKTTHQPRLTGSMDDSVAAARGPSYARLLRCIDELVQLS